MDSLKDACKQLDAGINQAVQMVITLYEAAQYQEEELGGAYQEQNQLTSQIIHMVDESQQQSATIEELSQMMRDFLEGFSDLLDSNDHSLFLIEKLSKALNKGQDSLHVTIDTINDLTSFSRDLVQFISKITNLSEQTNILAMNAAIQASKAGIFGKGFNVVAQEIRKLSYISQTLTEEISKKFKIITNKIDLGVKQANVTQEQLNLIIADFAIMINQSQKNHECLIDQTRIAHQVGESLDHSAESVLKTANAIEAIRSYAGRINNLIVDLKDISKQISTMTEQEGNDLQPMLINMENINLIIYHLYDLINQVEARAS